MNIAIDIDGVMTDTIKLVADDLTEILGRPVSPGEVAHEIGKIDGIDEIVEANGQRFFGSLDPFDGVVEAINGLNEVHNVYIISARFHLYYDMTLAWLKDHGIGHKKVIFTQGQSKLQVCQDHKIELFVEDSMVNAKELAEFGIKVLLYKTAYNQDLIHENVLHCHDWEEILEAIQDASFPRQSKS